MAKWALRAKHYLMVPGTEWEHKETSRDTGEEMTVRFPVCRFLDPDDPRQCNAQGELIVSNKKEEHNGFRATRCYYFLGPPGPEMEPLDAEATAISERESKNWQHPIDSLESTYSQSLLSDLQKQLAQAISKTSLQVQNDDITDLKKMVADLVNKNIELEKRLNAGTAPKKVA